MTVRIAQIAPLYESVPPRLYGGTERVVSSLTEELVRRGHDVTLFASGDSSTSARLVACCRRALRLDPSCEDDVIHHVLMLERVRQLANSFDVLHFHLDYLHLPLVRSQPVAHVTTMHGRLDRGDLGSLLGEVGDVPLVSISDSQRRPLPWANWQGTVYHGLPAMLRAPRARPGEYLAFLGRVSPEKRVDRAVEVARRVGLRLRVAAKVADKDRAYFDSLAPLFRESFVDFVGEVGEQGKGELLGNAYALLFPIDWPEPFGLVMIEAMACGTPVVAWRCGSVPEVVDEGVTGFIVESTEEAVAVLRDKVPTFDRVRCARVARERFSVRRMTSAYERIYERQALRRCDKDMTAA
jgi:glycosyltransferase involved in cell wall biosynthesis